jgi:hypothetical protein
VELIAQKTTGMKKKGENQWEKIWHSIFNIYCKQLHMLNTFTPEFIRNRIMDCGQAIIYRYIDEQHKQPLAMMKDVIIKDGEKIHFNLISAYAQIYGGNIFPVELFFYKKGNPFFITAKGSAEKEIGLKDRQPVYNLAIDIAEIEYHPLGAEKKKKLLFGFL